MMKLRQIATHDVVAVAPTDSVDKAIMLMEEHGIRHLPVTQHEKLVGIVSDRDLLSAQRCAVNASIEKTVRCSDHRRSVSLCLPQSSRWGQTNLSNVQDG